MSILMVIVTLTSCKDDVVDVDEVNKQTILVFMPWSGSDHSSGLYTAFKANLDSMKAGIRDAKGLKDMRLLVFISETANTSRLYEITYDRNEFKETDIKSYTGTLYTTSEGITEIIKDATTYAEALNYAMLIGCHGVGWTFKDTWSNYPYNAKRFGMEPAPREKPSNGYMTTRFYGSASDIAKFGTDIATLARGIEATGITMQYVLFDDCYMANVETAYEMRKATKFLIGSTSEVMQMGMPYHSMWRSLASPAPNYEAAVKAFNAFYSSYVVPCGTLAAIDCRQMDNLAKLMADVNKHIAMTDELRGTIQRLDGFNIPIFYDFGDYVDKACQDKGLKNQFKEALNTAVGAKSTTPKIYSYLYSEPIYVKIDTFSGITTSAPSTNPVVQRSIEQTSWWHATHPGQ